MSIRTYLLGVFIATVFFWAALTLVVINTNPNQGGNFALTAFYLSLFFALTGTATIFGYYLRIWFSRNEVIYANIGPALRQGILIATATIVILMLQRLKLLSIWSGFLLVLAILSLDFFFRAKKT